MGKSNFLSSMKTKKIVLYSLGLAAALGICTYQIFFAPSPEDHGEILARKPLGNGLFSIELLSEPYRLDQVYKSMTGPRGNQPGIRLLEKAPVDAVLWLTGLETRVVDASSLEPISNEYLCHSNLTLNPDTTTPEKYNASFASPTHARDWRLFTLIPGRMTTYFPEGFGIPIRNDNLLDYFTMALNQNPGHPERVVRMKTKITFRQTNASEPLKPLFRRAVYVYQQHKELSPGGTLSKAVGVKGHQGENCAESCPVPQTGATPSTFQELDKGLDRHPGATCCVANASPEGVVDQFGQENTVHWMVPPGKHLYRTEVTKQMNLPFDTTVHYVTGHLHPYGESLKLVDLESGQTVFEIKAGCFHDRLGVATMSEILSKEGIPVYQGRRYELLAEYHNTSTEPIDAMAILYFYGRDR